MRDKYCWLPYASIVLTHLYLITYIQYGEPIHYVYQEINQLERYCEEEFDDFIQTIEDTL